jgi:2-methylisocitrate lyase-like PEP mutase family enzyme
MSGSDRQGKSHSAAAQLRAQLSKGPVLMPGCWDALSARLAENAGFPAVCITGGGVSQTLIGFADLGYITQTEMLDTAHRIASAVAISVIADIDDGFGNVMNVRRTVAVAERIGLAGVHIEDVAAPKRCPELGGSTLVPIKDMVKKVEVAAACRSNPDFVLIVRTDNYEGMNELIRRAKAYESAGADMIMPIGLERRDDIARLADSISIPLWYGQIGGGSSPVVTLADAPALNIAVLAFTLEGFTSAYQAHREYLGRLYAVMSEPSSPMTLGPSFELVREFESVCGIADDQVFQEKYF